MTEDGLLALQRHFEEQYGKLEIPGVKRKNKRKRTGETEPPTEETADWEQEWGGIGDDKASNPDPKVVEFKETQETDQVDKKSYKSFMSSKLPKSAKAKKAAPEPETQVPSDDDAENLKNDVALQRLLRESNILAEYNDRDDPGRLRHRTLDSRISHLGGKELPNGNIPLRIRKGIEMAKVRRQEKKAREAQEAGLIMPTKRKGRPVKLPERGLNTKSRVGKFKNGMLQVSEREIRRINNAGSGISKKGKGVKKLFK